MTNFAATQSAQPEVVAVGEMMGLIDADSPGSLEDVRHFSLRVADPEGNVLIALAHHGHTVALVSAMGDDPIGRLILRTLHGVGVDVSYVRVDADAPTGLFPQGTVRR